ncbi:MAG: DUF72 domain-containing protein [Tahibacter sp.]
MLKRNDADSGPRIGCAGWSIGSAHALRFGDGSSMLARYATCFNAVEINTSFYRPHQFRTYARWAGSVPATFRFSVKIPKSISHEARLARCGAMLDRFVEEIGGLGEKLGGVLLQLPPSLAFDARVAATFFALLRRRLSAPIACEPRHASWFDASRDALWARYAIARVGADPPPVPQADDARGAGPWRYWRWHGSPQRYYSAYSDSALLSLAKTVRHNTPARVTPWIIFDNTALGHATADACRLQALLAKDANALHGDS